MAQGAPLSLKILGRRLGSGFPGAHSFKDGCILFRMQAFLASCQALCESAPAAHLPPVSVKAIPFLEAHQSLRPHAKCLSSPIKSRRHRNGLTRSVNKLAPGTRPVD